ncbi:MAG TPA: SDR family oxidoreductase [Gaiellaceae bacterium]|jgi:NAD(P)-dependent dehydrogenase (short-subunit alcohol dehydrogenase family)
MKVAVITGASSGIGAELVRRLKSEGWHTVGLSRRESEADEHETCDVADRASVDAAAARVLQRHPHIDLLISNAGIPARAKGFLDVDPERLELATATNFLGSVWVARAFVPGLGEGSHLVHIVSVAGQVADGPYSATKHAQLAVSRSLAVELAPRGVSVHTVNPGFIETPGFPQRGVRLGPLASKLVAEPSLVAERVLAAVKHDRREITVPRWYAPAGWLQALFPGFFARVRARVKA